MRGSITVEPRLGGGSVFTVELPVDDLELAPEGVPQVMYRTLISANPIPELNPASSPPGHAVPHASLAVARQAKLVPAVVPKNILQTIISAGARPNGKKLTTHDELHLNILIVDDNAISRKILIRMVKNSNVTTYEAEDGIYALEIYRKVRPQVVWTDISMPRMDGVTAAKEMRKIEREERLTPSHIIAITGLGLSDEYIRKEALLGPAALNGWLIKGQTNLSNLKETLVLVRQRLSAAS
ncbi:CheY-like superfamily [Mycena vitilis]|nr:CheY-like superfamily [Mycena vitilis]